MTVRAQSDAPDKIRPSLKKMLFDFPLLQNDGSCSKSQFEKMTTFAKSVLF